jgi:DNA-binding transcriptional MocR family regulator
MTVLLSKHGFTPKLVASGEVQITVGGRYTNCLRLSCGNGWDARIEKGLVTLGELASAALARQ